MGSFPFNSTYNASAFDGVITSDFMDLGIIREEDKKGLIDYSVADFDEYKEALINYLKAVSLDEYNNFVESDFGMFFIELFAYIAATNSLKADFIANELFYPTVKTSERLSGLLDLIGISMKGPVASKATATLSPDGFSFSSGDTLTVNQSDRVITLASQRDGKPLSYTLYKTNLATGLIDQSTAGNIEELELDDTFYDDSVNKFTGLVLLEGVLRSQSGSFSPRISLKTIRLNEPSIIEGSIYVSASDGFIYSEIDNLALASNGDDRVFSKKYNEDFSAELEFGDGIRGANPQANVTYTVFYRTGGGGRGDIVEGYIDASIPVIKNSTETYKATLTNSSQATGGSNSETVEHAKRYAPRFFRTQHRAVTGEDYNAIANSFVSVAGKTAKAIPVLRENGPTANMIDIYVLAKASDLQVERASLAFKGELLNHLNKYKMITDHVTIVDGVARTLDLVCTVFVNKSREADIENIKTKTSDKIVEFFNVDNREFGESFNIGELTNHVLSLSEIRFFKIDNVLEDIFVNFNELVQLNNLEINIELV